MGNTMDFSFSCRVGASKTCDTCPSKSPFPDRGHLPYSVRHVLMGRESQRSVDRVDCNPTTCSDYAMEYFLVFAIAGKEEFPTYKALQMGLIQKDFRMPMEKKVRGDDYYLSSVSNFKIFISLRGVRTRRQFFSFFIRLTPDPTLPETIIKPFPNSPVSSGFFFRGRFVFLTKKEVLQSVINENGESARFLKTQKMLPVEVLKQMISKDYSELRKGVRKLKI